MPSLRLCQFARVSAGSAKGRVAELRSVLRFLYLQGLTGLRLGDSVPAVGGWRFADLPPRVTSLEDVQRPPRALTAARPLASGTSR
jgi:hypothetical protein